MGKIEFDREDLAKKSRELMNLKRDINNILSGTKGTDKVLNRANKVSTMIQKRKLQELQNYAYNIVKEFDKLYDDFNYAVRELDNADDIIKRSLSMNLSHMENLLARKRDGDEDVFKDIEARNKLNEKEDEDFLDKSIDFLKKAFGWFNDSADEYFEKKKEFFAEFNKDYPILSKLFLPFQIIEGIDDGILKFVKDMTIGLVSDIFGFLKYEIEGLMTDPSGTLEENLDFIMKIGAIINPVTKEQYKIQEDFFNSIWESIKKSIDTEVVNGNPYSALKFVTDVVMNVASLFVGAGEIKELSALKKFGIILNEGKEINVLEKLIGKGVSNDNALKLINKLDVEELKKLHSFLEKKPSDFDASEIVDKILGGEKVDDVIKGVGKTKYDNIDINNLKESNPAELDNIINDIRENGGSPLDIPENATINAKSMNKGYQQIKYNWSDGTYKYESRWHTETPGAVKYDRGTTWVVTRTIPGNAQGQMRVTEYLIGDNWINEDIWNAAERANMAGKATQEQMDLLEAGHWLAK